MIGTDLDDFLYGGSGNEILEAGADDVSWQHHRGEAGDDISIVGKDSVSTLIHEEANNGMDTIRFDDLTLSDLTVSYVDHRLEHAEDDFSGNALKPSWNKDGHAGQIQVSKEGQDIERFEFADETDFA